MKKISSFCIIILSYIFLLLFLISASTVGKVSKAVTAEEHILNTILCCLITILGYFISIKVLEFIFKKCTSESEEDSEEKKIKPKVNIGAKIILSLSSLFLLLIISILFKKIFPSCSIQETKILPANITETKQIYFILPFIFLRNALIPAFFEEYYFRKKLPGTLSSVCKISYPIAVIISSLLFCSAHTGGISHVIFAFLSAVILSLLVHYTETLKYAVSVHFIYNFITIVLMLR